MKVWKVSTLAVCAALAGSIASAETAIAQKGFRSRHGASAKIPWNFAL